MKYLDNEEKDLDKALDKVDINSIKKPSKKQQNLLKKGAKQYLKSETKMNIRIDPNELNLIKKKAEQEGLKYQTFIKSVLHKYISGQLIEKKNR